MIGLLAGVLGSWVLGALSGPFAPLLPTVLWLLVLTTSSGAITGLVTMMWLRGAAQLGNRLSPVRAGLTAGLIVGAVVGTGASLVVGLVAGPVLGAVIPSAVAGVAAGAVTGVAGVPLGCTVKGWLEAE